MSLDNELAPVTIVGVGPGDARFLTLRGREALEQADLVAGFKTVLDVVEPWVGHAEVCPMRLEPAVLLQAIELEQHDLARRLHPEACVECGLCSYVCPSSLPLASNIALGIRRLRDE